jgi:competence protein ComEA
MSRIKSLSALAALSLGLIAASLAYAQGGAAAPAATPAAPATEAAKPAVKAAPAKAHAAMKAAPAVAMPKCDINSASREDLMKLAGIGDATADKIVAGRPFKTKKDLLTKGLVTKSQYSKISGHIIAKQEAAASK